MNHTLEKPVRMLCQSCGGSLEFADEGHAVCKYCGSRYLVDDVKGLVAEVTISGGERKQTRVILKIALFVLIVFFVVALIVVVKLWEKNEEARNPKEPVTEENKNVANMFSIEEYEHSDNILIPFCEDIFEKEFSQITREEFERIRYLAEVEDVWNGNVLRYSFTDYKDCEDEEEFQDTIETWKIKADIYALYIPQLTGLTRIENLQKQTMESMEKNVDLTYVAVDELWMDSLHEVVNPESLEGLSLTVETDLYHYAGLDYLQKYVNLKELHIDGYSFYLEDHEKIDATKFTVLKKLEKLHLSGWGQEFDNLETLEELNNLRSLTLEINISNYSEPDFWSKFSKLEELRIGSLPKEFDAGVFAKMTNLRVLCLPDWILLTSELIEALPLLEEITGMASTKATVETISELENLRSVELKMVWDESEKNLYGTDFPLIDMSLFANKPDMEHMKLYGAGAEHVELLLNHSKLKSLNVNNAYNMTEEADKAEIWIDTTKLVDNSALIRFSANHCKLMDSSTGARVDLANLLGHYPRIKLLELQNMRLINIAPIGNCKNLRECDLRYNKIQDFSPLQECKRLELLHVYENPRESIEKIDLSPEVIVNTDILDVD